MTGCVPVDFAGSVGPSPLDPWTFWVDFPQYPTPPSPPHHEIAPDSFSPTTILPWRKQRTTTPFPQNPKPDMSSTVAARPPVPSLSPCKLTTLSSLQPPPRSKLPQPFQSLSDDVGCPSTPLHELRASPQADQGSYLRDSIASLAAR